MGLEAGGESMAGAGSTKPKPKRAPRAAGKADPAGPTTNKAPRAPKEPKEPKEPSYMETPQYRHQPQANAAYA